VEVTTMPITKEGLPSTIARSPRKVQRTYAEVLDSAHEQYRSEERAHRVAYAAVKHIAEKRGDHWELKDGKGPSDPQAAKDTPASRERPGRTRGGVDLGKSKQELYEDAKRAGIEGRSNMTKDQLARALQKHSGRKTAQARG
jgi:cation transport regulator ChaB